MALYTNSGKTVKAVEKKTRQGTSKRTKLSASSANGRRKRYRGQGRR